MDEMQLLAAVLDKPDQTPEAIDEGRRRLNREMHGQRRHRTAWLMGGLGLTAAAATAAVVVVSGTTAPTHTPNGPPKAAPAPTTKLSAKQVLLAAASTALTTPEGSGAYWHVKTGYTKGNTDDRSNPSVIETWVRRDGKSWVRTGGGSAIVNDGKNGHYTDGFDVAEKRLSLQQIKGLPTEPGALKAWINKNGPKGLPKSFAMQGALIGLLSGSPAPPKIRAAAFKLLAAMPHVKSLGPVKGGQGLLLPDPEGRNMVVVNTATAKLSGLFAGVLNGKKIYGSDETMIAEWTDTAPPGVKA